MRDVEARIGRKIARRSAEHKEHPGRRDDVKAGSAEEEENRLTAEQNSLGHSGHGNVNRPNRANQKENRPVRDSWNRCTRTARIG
ncbi:hypothetical protein KI387_017626 [Taxus chinensis]|uniref:Uncharacterized protein n=1 Tax=Taxus chinensis TaxID=29808 RepID=A0AA38LJ73_TAXCH|nr:hypothetical protein KI387_017626 [Taxus chinensis]